MPANLLLLCVCLGQMGPKPPTAPEAPPPSDPVGPVLADARDGGPDLAKGDNLPDAPLPPSLTIDALSEELKGASRAGRIRAAQERAKLDEEKSQLREMNSQIEKARHELREETHALQAMARPSPRAAPVEGVATTPLPVKHDSLSSLAKTLQGMKPVQAATLLEHLDPGLAVELFRLLRPSDAAPIVEKLKPETAAHLFSALATRSALPQGSGR